MALTTKSLSKMKLTTDQKARLKKVRNAKQRASLEYKYRYHALQKARAKRGYERHDVAKADRQPARRSVKAIAQPQVRQPQFDTVTKLSIDQVFALIRMIKG